MRNFRNDPDDRYFMESGVKVPCKEPSRFPDLHADYPINPNPEEPLLI